MTTVAYRGNFGVSFSTESHIAGSLEQLGCEVIRIQENEVDWSTTVALCRDADLFLWTCTKGYALGWDQADAHAAVRTLNGMLPTAGVHLDLWFGLAREADVGVDPFWKLQHLFTADGDHQAEFEARHVTHHWLPPAVYGPECFPGTPRPEYAADVAFVGNWRGGYHDEWWPHRERLLSHLQGRHGARMWPVRQAIRGADLNALYASTKITVGDSCFADRSTRYFSDRPFESVGRGAFVLFPYIEGLAELLTDGEHIRYYPPGDMAELSKLIHYYLLRDDEREAIRAQGQQFVRENHTYADRMRTLLTTVGVPLPEKAASVPMIPTLINGRWTLLLPEHRANRAEWVTGWERERWDSIHANVREGDTVLDIGTEEGDLSALLATWVGPTGKVALFEPTPAVWGNVRAIFEGNGLTDRVAAWFVGFAGPVERHAPDPERLREPVGRWPRCAYGPVIGDHGFSVIHERPDFPVVTIDRFCEEHGLAPDLLTLDVEGAELEVLHGAGRVLETHHPLVYVSVHEAFMADSFGRHHQELWTFLGDMGYEATELAVDHERHVVWAHPSRAFVAPDAEQRVAT